MVSRAPGASAGVLAGLRVIELGSYVAAPTAGRLLASFGADVIKVERPGDGDEARRWHIHAGETSMLWRSLGRGKRSVTIDVRRPEGRDLLLELVSRSDVVLEGFRPGTLERLGLGPDQLVAVNPEVILVRLSGFGQDGPYRDRAGFGSVAEAMGGLRHLTGSPDRPPSRVGVSLGDSVAGLYAAIGTLLALLGRVRPAGWANDASDDPSAPRTRTHDGAPAETVDVSLYESVYSLLDSVVAEYEAFGVVRQRMGSTIAGVAPSNAYRCADGSYVVIGANGDRVFIRLLAAIGREELADDPRYQGAEARAAAADELDRIIGEWTGSREPAEVVAAMDRAGVPATPIFDAADIHGDPHFAARGANEAHRVPLAADDTVVSFPAPVPRLSRRPARPRWAGPELGEHTGQVLSEILGLSPERQEHLASEGVI